ncbi:MAG: hypothetical protein OXE92_09905 [Bacteroidetes bacterium]|nr:hypothetical protein [Bacteroidota bacterium]MCY4206022.1 hypothetical protein [Bacteroidota bacterium]
MTKSNLGLQPIYHRKDQRIEGRLFIMVLAYHTTHLVRALLKNMMCTRARIRFGLNLIGFDE